MLRDITYVRTNRFKWCSHFLWLLCHITRVPTCSKKTLKFLRPWETFKHLHCFWIIKKSWKKKKLWYVVSPKIFNSVSHFLLLWANCQMSQWQLEVELSDLLTKRVNIQTVLCAWCCDTPNFECTEERHLLVSEDSCSQQHLSDQKLYKEFG